MKPSRIRFLLLCCALGTLSGCFEDAIPFLETSEYHLNGIEDDQVTHSYLEDILENRVSQTESSSGDDADRRESFAEETIRTDLEKALNAKGYYDASVKYQDDTNKPRTGSYDVKAGPLYHLSSVKIKPPAYEGFLDQIGVKAGDVLDAASILAAQEALFKLAQKDTCYFGLEVHHGVVLDDARHTGSLGYTVKAGPPATFGAVSFQGQQSVEVAYLEKLIPWRMGSCYRAGRIERLRSALMESGLFSRADVKLPEGPDAEGRINIVVDLKERAQRTVQAGLSYYTDQGAGATFGWEHRNFFGQAEKVQVDLTLSQIKQSLEAELTKPFFLRKDQTLSLTTSLRHQDTDAFKEVGLDFGSGITRRFNRRLSGSLGADFNLTRIEEENEDKKVYGLVSFPGTLNFDNRDNKLDPHKGWAINGGLTPYFDVLGESNPFLKGSLGVSTYLALGTQADIVLATRGSIGSIMGASTANVPATERFYAGGGGTVRGFGYQEVGPQEDGTPTGGRSLVTASSELRFKMTETIGAVAFVDAGSVSESAVPEFSDLSVGAGVGLRYYTSFGPLRFDVAVPLTQRETLDQTYQIYLSIGQAF